MKGGAEQLGAVVVYTHVSQLAGAHLVVQLQAWAPQIAAELVAAAAPRLALKAIGPATW